MSEAEPGNAGPDQTTDAIYDLIKTMGGAGGGTAKPEGALVFTPQADQPDTTSVEERNGRVEDQLFDQGVLRRVSPIQRRLLGCIACRLQRNGDAGTGEPAELRTAEIAQCAGVTFDPARKLLDSLRGTGLLHGEVKRTTDRGVNAPTQWFSLTEQARETGFAGAIAAPEECGLTDEARQRLRQPVKPRPPLTKLTNDTINRDAEQFLIDKGIFQSRSATRRAALGCMACQLNRGSNGTYGLQIARCQGMTHTTPGVIFSDLEKRGIVTSTFAEGRVLYSLSIQNHLGRGLDRLLEVPQQCGLERTIETES